MLLKQLFVTNTQQHMAVAQAEIVFMVAGVAWLGASAGRVHSALLDRNVDVKNIGGIALESGLGTLLALPTWFALLSA